MIFCYFSNLVKCGGFLIVLATLKKNVNITNDTGKDNLANCIHCLGLCRPMALILSPS